MINQHELVSHIQDLQHQLSHLRRSLQTQIEPDHFDRGNLAPQLDRLTRSVETLRDQVTTLITHSVAPEDHWQVFLSSLPVGIFTATAEGNCVYLNPTAQHLLGKTIDECLEEGWTKIIHPQDVDRVVSGWQAATAAQQPYDVEYRILLKTQDVRWVHVQTAPILSAAGILIGHTGAIADITTQRHADDQLKASLREKEALLKEIHHRVKNNLQIISSLIYLQAQRITDPKARQLFEDSQSRISSMALVHDSLYRSQNFAQINLSEYLQTLTQSLFHTYRLSCDRVKLTLNVTEDITVSIDRAIPCGLILNELITNALKHGFANNVPGMITVELRSVLNESHSKATQVPKKQRIYLIVENDGNTLPESFELQKIESMGLRLVDALVQQLQGEVKVDKTHKTRFKIAFDEA